MANIYREAQTLNGRHNITKRFSSSILPSDLDYRLPLILSVVVPTQCVEVPQPQLMLLSSQQC